MILPGATLGILGGGQLGKMFAVAAQTLGYRVVVLDPDRDCPAHGVCHEHIVAEYDDHAGLAELRRICAAVTTEFENVPAASLRYLAESVVVRPDAAAVAISQNRASEKQFLRDAGFATARFALVDEAGALSRALEHIGFPAILKTSTFGYDGKGQYRIASIEDAQRAFADTGQRSCVIEEQVALALEISVVLARSSVGAIAAYPAAENVHSNGILDMSLVPARIDPRLAGQATEVAARIANTLDYVGVMAVEFFVLGDGRLLVNEIAPRPHNSGHFTLDACVTSQFEQQVRALCDLPLGTPDLVQPAVMVNLLGDLWQPEPDWASLFEAPSLKLHLYGKLAPRRGRKMGHFTCSAAQLEAALTQAQSVRRRLGMRLD